MKTTTIITMLITLSMLLTAPAFAQTESKCCGKKEVPVAYQPLPDGYTNVNPGDAGIINTLVVPEDFGLTIDGEYIGKALTAMKVVRKSAKIDTVEWSGYNRFLYFTGGDIEKVVEEYMVGRNRPMDSYEAKNAAGYGIDESEEFFDASRPNDHVTKSHTATAPQVLELIGYYLTDAKIDDIVREFGLEKHAELKAEKQGEVASLNKQIDDLEGQRTKTLADTSKANAKFNGKKVKEFGKIISELKAERELVKGKDLNPEVWALEADVRDILKKAQAEGFRVATGFRFIYPPTIKEATDQDLFFTEKFNDRKERTREEQAYDDERNERLGISSTGTVLMCKEGEGTGTGLPGDEDDIYEDDIYASKNSSVNAGGQGGLGVSANITYSNATSYGDYRLQQNLQRQASGAYYSGYQTVKRP